MITLTKRLVVGRELTWVEMDNNWDAIQTELNGAVGKSVPVKFSGVSEDATLEDLIPAGCMVLYALVKNLTGNAAQLSCKEPITDEMLFSRWVIKSNGYTVIPINVFLSDVLTESAFLGVVEDDDTWNGAEIDITFVILTLV